ncbi:BTAD domain-containing putative transcriptional regulator [Paenibacillus sp. CF384]|uniref:AfsR/SARP family transcriptional regulator n=1 Tax=Paenibacillus sp. CF384 TaxID=1884382 RepID=UPI00089C6FBC|nr:BTAD domain-containing putative transcriptional regulator [Paenibacillus sp. CF384]SDX29466.1 DNA-binding transcriptional activator of the SARP family [Paenibacillus sp. CF384]
MKQPNKVKTNQDGWQMEVLKAERTILDGQMPAIAQLLAIPADIRMKSPLLLRAECEDGLLRGRLVETKLRLEAALRGFAAQADDSSMLTMMAMLGLLYEQVGDKQESKPVMALLAQEWARNPENCSGFVPWALAHAAANGAAQYEQAQRLFIMSAERFREEGKPLWLGFVLLDRLLFDPLEKEHPDWQLWLHWLKRHMVNNPSGTVLVHLLTSKEPGAELCAMLPERFAYLSKAILMQQPEENLSADLAEDIESSIFASGARMKRLLQEGQLAEAEQFYPKLDRLRKLVSTPAIDRFAAELKQSMDDQANVEANTITFFAQEQIRQQQLNELDQQLGAGLLNREEVQGAGLEPTPESYDDHAPTAEINTAKWRVQLIDGISFSTPEGKLAEPVWKRRKAGELLVYLLLQPGYKANREQVIEKVFGEGDPAKRSNQLYVTLHDLRSSLKELGMPEDLVYAKRGVVGISEVTFEAIDVESYLTLSRVGDQLWADDREEACRLYDKALPLYGLLGTELPYAEWLERVREQLLDRQTNMIKRIAGYYGELHDEARVEQSLAEWIALRPEQEEAYEAMIRLCLRGDRRIEAIGWYRRLERVCKEELGSEPLEEVRSLLWN